MDYEFGIEKTALGKIVLSLGILSVILDQEDDIEAFKRLLIKESLSSKQMEPAIC